MELLVMKFERTPRGYSHGMRDIATIDSELRFLTRVSRAARVFNGQLGEPALTAAVIDLLLDERAAATAALGSGNQIALTRV
jgi:hypothetical protein